MKIKNWEAILWDCLEVMKTMESESVDFILTDIPYDISKNNNFKSIKDFTKKDWLDSEYKWIDFWEWDKNIFDLEEYIRNCIRIMKNWTSAFIWCSYQQLSLIEEYYKKHCPKSKQWALRIWIWQKLNPSVFNMDKMPINPFEVWIWFRKWSKWTFNRKEDWKATRLYWETAYATWPHPTQKRVDICEDIIKTFTNEWMVVFDWTAWILTTWEACENTNRKWIWIEKDETYYNIWVERINNLKI